MSDASLKSLIVSFGVSKIIYLILLLVDIHVVHWDKIQSCSKRNTNAVLRQIRTKFGVTRSFLKLFMSILFLLDLILMQGVYIL